MVQIANAAAAHIAIRLMRCMWEESRIIEKIMLKRLALDSN